MTQVFLLIKCSESFLFISIVKSTDRLILVFGRDTHEKKPMLFCPLAAACILSKQILDQQEAAHYNLMKQGPTEPHFYNSSIQ